jgi:hypothetical protein
MESLVKSELCSSGDLAGVFEFDGDTAYFYLYQTGAKANERICDAVLIASGPFDVAEEDISIRWDVNEQRVGLCIRGMLWAAFDCHAHLHFGGSYNTGDKSTVPAHISQYFPAQI